MTITSKWQRMFVIGVLGTAVVACGDDSGSASEQDGGAIDTDSTGTDEPGTGTDGESTDSPETDTGGTDGQGTDTEGTDGVSTDTEGTDGVSTDTAGTDGTDTDTAETDSTTGEETGDTDQGTDTGDTGSGAIDAGTGDAGADAGATEMEGGAGEQDLSAYPVEGPLTVLAVDQSGIFDEGASEIVDFHPATQRMFIVDADAAAVRVAVLDEQGELTEEARLDPVTDIGGDFAADVATSVAVSNDADFVAVAVSAAEPTAPGRVAVYDAASLEFVTSVEVGVLPDMLTFIPGRAAVVVACEGEQDRDADDKIISDPPGSISLVDLTAGTASAVVYDLGFDAFDARIEEFRAKGVRIPVLDGSYFASGSGSISLSGDLEPEYVAISPDGSTAFVTLQENSAFAVVMLPEDLSTASIADVVPMGLKDHSRGLPSLKSYEVLGRSVLGTTPGGQDILVGGFSGLVYAEGESSENTKIFYAIPDRGPNGSKSDINADHDGSERPHLLPDYHATIHRLVLDETSGSVTVDADGAIALMRADGTTPITGLPNDPLLDSSEFPVDSEGNALPYDAFGGDFEGILIDATDGSFWMCDEYRPAIYNFGADGVLLSRFVPEGTAAAAEGAPAAGTFGTETLPAVYAKRRANRGFEAIALDTDEQVIYTWIQTPIENPDRAASDASHVIRILGIDADKSSGSFGQPVHEYVYLLDKPDYRAGNVDKIGDAVYAGAGKFLVVERDSSFDTFAKKSIFEIDVKGATDLIVDPPTLADGMTLEQHTPELLVAQGIKPVAKRKVVNPPSIGYTPGDKTEGITLLEDGRIALINDNDFGVADAELVGDGNVELNDTFNVPMLGVISFDGDSALDASDEDSAVNIKNWPTFGMYMPDGITSYETNGALYYITANEGDSRDYDETRVEDLTLDSTVFSDSTLQSVENLGRLQCSAVDGDIDGDGDVDRIYSFGARSITIWDVYGNLVWDSGAMFERMVAEMDPTHFNSDNDDNDSFDSRSDAKGPEPETVVVGEIDGTSYAFVALERMGGVMIVDVTDPLAPEFVDYVNARNFDADAESAAAGDLGPEGLKFIKASDSPTGEPLLIVANEVSGTTTVFQINL